MVREIAYEINGNHSVEQKMTITQSKTCTNKKIK